MTDIRVPRERAEFLGVACATYPGSTTQIEVDAGLPSTDRDRPDRQPRSMEEKRRYRARGVEIERRSA